MIESKRSKIKGCINILQDMINDSFINKSIVYMIRELEKKLEQELKVVK